MNPRLLALRAAITAAVERMTEMHETATAADRDLTDDERTEWDGLDADVTAHQVEAGEIEAREARLAAARDAGTVVAVPGGDDHADTPPGGGEGARTTPFDRLADVRTFDPSARMAVRDLALEVVEDERSDLGGYFEDAHREELARKLRSYGAFVDADPHNKIPLRVLTLSAPAYRSAWAKLMSGNAHTMNSDESRALERATMNVGTNGQGGFAVPTHLDPTMILTDEGYTNPVRARARTENLVEGNTWNGISTAGVTASYDTESAQVSDDSPTVAQPSVDVEKAQAFVAATIEATQDIANLGDQLLALIVDAKDELEATKFVLGSGTNEPHGVVQALIDDTSKTITSAGSDVFALADVYATQENLGPRFRAQASWLAELAIINDIRQFATANNYNGFLTDLSGDSPVQLLGKPLDEATAMDGTYGSGENYVLAFGDLGRGFVVVDKIGLSMEFVPLLMNTADNRPDGTRGWYAYWRNGSGLLNVNAFSLLNIT